MIKLSLGLVEKCREHGAKVVREYGGGDHAKSKALSVRGIEFDPIVQAEGKMAECIFAIERGLDPLTALNWVGPELNGIDVVANGIAVDVKQTKPGNRYLIWSVGKTGKLASKEMDVFVLVLCSFAAAGGESVAWITKRRFIAEHKVAPPPLNLLPGTMYMDRSNLLTMATFPASRRHLYAKPDGLPQSTWDAFEWLRKYKPEQLDSWLLQHPEVPR